MSLDLLAPHYTWMEKVLAGPRLQRARTAFLDQLAGCERILVAGVGHGHFLRACARRLPSAEIVSVDASAGMLARAQRSALAAPGPERLRFLHAAIPAWRPEPGAFDAIVTHFFLDCFPPADLAEVVAALAAGARAQARWLITDFALPPHGWRRHRARAIHAAMYTFFRPVTRIRARRVTPPDHLLRAAGFALTARRSAELGLIQTDLWTRG
jgi:SAM-dependent methyltransferase